MTDLPPPDDDALAHGQARGGNTELRRREAEQRRSRRDRSCADARRARAGDRPALAAAAARLPLHPRVGVGDLHLARGPCRALRRRASAMPVDVPWPHLGLAVMSVTVLSALTASNESTFVDVRHVARRGRAARLRPFPQCRHRATAEADDQRAAALDERSCARTPSRGSGLSSRTSLRHHCRSLLDRGQDPRIRTATAEMPVHRRADLLLGRALRRREQVSSLDHHAVLAIAAMRHLNIDPRLLQRMQRRSRSRRAALRPPTAPAAPRAS